VEPGERSIVRVDGSRGEGGGQIVRTSLSLAAVLGRPFEIHDLRAKRRRPGLQPQHLTAVRAAAELCGADVAGAEVGSSSFSFVPRRPVSGGRYRFEIGTAGAATLVAQTVLAPLALAPEPSEVVVVGGTHLPFSPSFEYLRDVYIPTLRRSGWELDVDSGRAGFYPAGGGEVRAATGPSDPSGFDLTQRGAIRTVEVEVVTSRLPDHVRERAVRTAEDVLAGIADVTIRTSHPPAFTPGAAVTVRVVHDGGVAGSSSIGERGRPMEDVTADACGQALRWLASDAACDEHLADQLVLPACLSSGPSRWTTDRVTEHLRTVLWLASLFDPLRHSVERGPGEAWTVKVEPLGR